MNCVFICFKSCIFLYSLFFSGFSLEIYLIERHLVGVTGRDKFLLYLRGSIAWEVWWGSQPTGNWIIHLWMKRGGINVLVALIFLPMQA